MVSFTGWDGARNMKTNMRIFRVALLLRIEPEGVRRAAGSGYMDMTFDYFRIAGLEEIETVFSQIRDSYDGFLTDSPCADRIIEMLAGDRDCVHGYFDIGLENYYRQVLLLTMREPGLEVKNIRLDVLPEELNLNGIIAGDRLAELIAQEHERLRTYSMRETLAYEDEAIKRHIRHHRDNPSDLVLTGSAYVYEGLGKLGDYVRYISLTGKEIQERIETMRYELERRTLMASRSACLYFDMGEHPGAEDMEAVKQALIDFRESIGLPELIYNTVGDRYELPTDAATLDVLTRGMHVCRYTDYLRTHSGVNVHVGYGIGTTLQDARDGALTALEYAGRISSQVEQVYLIGTDGHMTAMEIEPENTGAESEADAGSVSGRRRARAGRQEPIIAAHVTEIAKSSHLASSTVFRLLTLLQKQKRTRVDSEWMISELGMSARMANKVLSSLEKAGYARIAGKSLISAKGRPSNIYELHFDMKC